LDNNKNEKIDVKLGTTPKTKLEIFNCDICKCSFPDNMAYIDHINGKKHNLMLGQSLRVKQSTAESVREKLLLLKRKTERPRKQIGGNDVKINLDDELKEEK
jgi:U4/U6.U5 tri-snRNP component SNU23